MTLLTTEQSAALEQPTRRERIEAVISVLVGRLERDLRAKALRLAISVVEDAYTKEEAIAALRRQWNAEQP